MTNAQFKRAQGLIAMTVGVMVAMAVVKNSFMLALIGVVAGMIAARILYQKSRQLADERILTVAEKASRYAYSISMPILGITAFLLTMWGRQGNETYMLIGSVLAYATCLMLGVYSIAFYLLNRKYGAQDAE